VLTNACPHHATASARKNPAEEARSKFVVLTNACTMRFALFQCRCRELTACVDKAGRCVRTAVNAQPGILRVDVWDCACTVASEHPMSPRSCCSAQKTEKNVMTMSGVGE
jgi:hypothetical protein